MALNIIFMGTPHFAVPILKSLYNSNHNILQVYTQTPKKKNRGQKVKPSPVHEFCLKNEIKVKHPENLNDESVSNYIKSLNPDVVVVTAYGKIIPKKILEIKKGRFINIHASLLPKWRGAAPIHRSIMSLDKETGISIMQIIPELDEGPVMMQSKVKISRNTNFQKLSFELSNLGSKMILKSLELIENEQDKFIPQDERYASYAKKISKDEAKINWKISAEKIVAMINALHLSPGAWFNYEGTRIKILKAKEVEQKGRAGEIIDKNFTIACEKKSIQILEIQKEGKQKMSIDEYLKGNSLKIGHIID